MITNSVINIDFSLFLKDYETFQRCLLPVIIEDRIEKGLKELNDEEIMDLFLDLINQYKNANTKSS